MQWDWNGLWPAVAALFGAAALIGFVWRRRGFNLAPAPAHAALDPDAALDKLRRGGERLAHGERLSPRGRAKLAALAKQQQPFAVLVGCSDSRVAPELIFGCGLGDLFVVRMAGNTVSDRGLGSVVYGVEILGASLIVVLGHARCGAVEAAVRLVEDDSAFTGALRDAITPVIPAVRKAMETNPPDLVHAAVHENVRSIVEFLKTAAPELSRRVADGSLKVVGAYYDLVTGEVEFLGEEAVSHFH